MIGQLSINLSQIPGQCDELPHRNPIAEILGKKMDPIADFRYTIDKTECCDRPKLLTLSLKTHVKRPPRPSLGFFIWSNVLKYCGKVASQIAAKINPSYPNRWDNTANILRIGQYWVANTVKAFAVNPYLVFPCVNSKPV